MQILRFTAPIWLVVILVLPTRAYSDTTFFVVRHAEKESDRRDPGLTPTGTSRAQTLARTLRSAGITACYSTHYQRTRQTAQPTAKMSGVEITTYQAGKEKQLVTRLLKAHASDEGTHQGILIAGHSNTVPALLQAMGIRSEYSIEEDHYDNLFVIRVSDNQPASFLHLHYGDPNP